mmetsp:Transcript_22855/g.48961  ORF Transcript_22855/g.48961 Transcript_22855/m.48961 type:complete len:365 (+) Transcript_22855:471-1565(+)
MWAPPCQQAWAQPSGAATNGKELPSPWAVLYAPVPPEASCSRTAQRRCPACLRSPCHSFLSPLFQKPPCPSNPWTLCHTSNPCHHTADRRTLLCDRHHPCQTDCPCRSHSLSHPPCCHDDQTCRIPCRCPCRKDPCARDPCPPCRVPHPGQSRSLAQSLCRPGTPSQTPFRWKARPCCSSRSARPPSQHSCPAHCFFLRMVFHPCLTRHRAQGPLEACYPCPLAPPPCQPGPGATDRPCPAYLGHQHQHQHQHQHHHLSPDARPPLGPCLASRPLPLPGGLGNRSHRGPGQNLPESCLCLLGAAQELSVLHRPCLCLRGPLWAPQALCQLHLHRNACPCQHEDADPAHPFHRVRWVLCLAQTSP